MDKKSTIIVAVVAAVVIVVAAIVAVVIINNNNNSPETKDSVVGCYFDYKVAGDYGDNYYPIDGTAKITILEENDTQYKLQYNMDIYYTDGDDKKTTILQLSTSEWVDKTDYSTPTKESTDKKISTYWGEKDVKKYVETSDDTTDTTYMGYDGKVMFEEVLKYEPTDSSKRYILITMLKDTDFITKSKSDSFTSYYVKMNVTGSMAYGTETYNLTGYSSIEYLDATSTCSKIKSTSDVKMGSTPILNGTTTTWEENDDSKETYGVKTATETITTSNWGTVTVDKYVTSTTIGTASSSQTTYLYKDAVPLKIVMTKADTSMSYSMTLNFEITELKQDGKDVTNLDDVLDW